jgi:putative membrane protein
MSEHRRHRRPAAFRLDDDRVTVSPVREAERDINSAVLVVPEPDSAALPVPIRDSRALPRRGFRWGALFWCAAGGLVLLAIALGIFDLIKDFFTRNAELGWLGLALVTLAALPLAVIGIRETAGLLRLANVEHLHQRAADVIAKDDRDKGGVLVKDLIALTHKMPRLARARTNLQGHFSDIIDGADLIRLAERELMAPLDQEARGLIGHARVDRHRGELAGFDRHAVCPDHVLQSVAPAVISLRRAAGDAWPASLAASGDFASGADRRTGDER